MAVTYVRNPETGAFEKIGPGNSTTDITLSVSGKAADAKIVGEVVSGKIAAPASGEVGQVLTVSAINEDGKPIAWETTNMPSIEGLATEAYVDEAIDANRVTVDAELSADSENPVQNMVVNAAMDALEGSLNSKITEATSSVVNYTEQTLSEEQQAQVRANIGAASESEVDAAIDAVRAYTDTKVADLVNSAPETLDTLGELAAAMEENADVVEALDNAIGTKANTSDLTAHTGNITVHITDSERSTWNAIEGKVKTYADGLVADKATVAYVDEQVSDKATMEYVDNTVPLMIDIVTSTNDAGAMTFTLPEEWNFATLQAQWAAGRLVVLKANNLLYICGAISDTLMRFETVYEAQYRAKEAYVRSYFTLTSDNAFNYHSTIIRHPTYVRFYNSNGVNYLDGYTFDDLNTMVDNNYPVFLYRVFTDNIKYVYHFHKKNVSNGVTSLIFYYQDGLNLYQAVVKSDGGFSNGYYALVASSRTINGKPLSANIVLTPEDIGVETPDWNVNDESNAAYIKNRPFYESDSCTVGSYLGGYIRADANGTKTARLYDVDLTMLELGATYHITFLEQDSPYAEIASYDWVAKEWNSTSNDPYYVGNPIIYADSGSLGEDSGEPAVLYTRDGAAYMAIDTRREPLTVITGLLNVVISKDAGLKTLDERYIPDTIARTGHIHSWNELNDKPFYSEGAPFGSATSNDTGDTLYWDGNTAGLESVQDGLMTYYRVSPATPSAAELDTSLVDGAAMGMWTHEGNISMGDARVLVCREDNTELSGFVFSKGIYFLIYEGIYVAEMYIPGYAGFKGVVKQLDEKYIPESIARKSDLASVMPSVTTADNGKFLRVVDGVWAATTVPRAEDLEV